jgi:hypothetical protein
MTTDVPVAAVRYIAKSGLFADAARRMTDMPIDLAQVDWLYVIVLAVLVFIASGIGNLVAFASRGTAAVLSAILFAAMFVAWTYYPHGLPLPTRLAGAAAPVVTPPASVVPATPEAPARPRNPVRDITPPAGPAR